VQEGGEMEQAIEEFREGVNELQCEYVKAQKTVSKLKYKLDMLMDVELRLQHLVEQEESMHHWKAQYELKKNETRWPSLHCVFRGINRTDPYDPLGCCVHLITRGMEGKKEMQVYEGLLMLNQIMNNLKQDDRCRVLIPVFDTHIQDKVPRVPITIRMIHI
jgi:hypothetical protein